MKPIGVLVRNYDNMLSTNIGGFHLSGPVVICVAWRYLTFEYVTDQCSAPSIDRMHENHVFLRYVERSCVCRDRLVVDCLPFFLSAPCNSPTKVFGTMEMACFWLGSGVHMG